VSAPDGQLLADLIVRLRASPALGWKQDLQAISALFASAPSRNAAGAVGEPIRNGDDAAAVRIDDGYMLLAAEGMLPAFVRGDPWFAGYCAVMVNVSDIAAMGGTPLAIVDVLFDGGADTAALLAGMREGAETFGVPIVGGHTSRADAGTYLAAAILGRARRLITSFDARPGDDMLLAIDMGGAYRGDTLHFDAATASSPQAIRRRLAILPGLADVELVRAGKDVSMAGIVGTLAMLAESSGCGATLELDRLPRPDGTSLDRWLQSFPSFGFILAAEPRTTARICERFASEGVTCAAVGRFQAERRVQLTLGAEQGVYWDLASEPLTGFSAETPRKSDSPVAMSSRSKEDANA
jgi:AIR synthase-related protein